MADKKTITEYIPNLTSEYVDPSTGMDETATFEECLINGNNVRIETINIEDLKIEDSSSWVHDNPTSAKIDMDSVAAMINNDLKFPELQVTLDDLSTGQAVNTDLR